MTRHAITPKDDAHWHALRTKHVTSTDCAKLFNASPYGTHFELWHEKKDGVPVTIEDNERMEVGREIEPVIARLFARRYGVRIRNRRQFVYQDLTGFGNGIGASFDYEVIGLSDEWTSEDATVRQLYEQHGVGNLECKNVDWLVHRNRWDDDEAPAHIEMQVQHQLEVDNRPWSALVALVGGNTLRTIIRPRDVEFGRVIRKRATEFWQSIAMNQPPKPIMPDDAEAVIALYAHAEPGKFLDLTDDEEFATLAAEYQRGMDMEKEADEIKKSSRAMMLEKVGDAERIVTTGYKISAGPVAPYEGKLVTPEMVGQYIGARAGRRNWRLTPLKEKEQA